MVSSHKYINTTVVLFLKTMELKDIFRKHPEWVFYSDKPKIAFTEKIGPNVTYSLEIFPPLSVWEWEFWEEVSIGFTALF